MDEVYIGHVKRYEACTGNDNCVELRIKGNPNALNLSYFKNIVDVMKKKIQSGWFAYP